MQNLRFIYILISLLLSMNFVGCGSFSPELKAYSDDSSDRWGWANEGILTTPTQAYSSEKSIEKQHVGVQFNLIDEPSKPTTNTEYDYDPRARKPNAPESLKTQNEWEKASKDALGSMR